MKRASMDTGPLRYEVEVIDLAQQPESQCDPAPAPSATVRRLVDYIYQHMSYHLNEVVVRNLADYLSREEPGEVTPAGYSANFYFADSYLSIRYQFAVWLESSPPNDLLRDSADHMTLWMSRITDICFRHAGDLGRAHQLIQEAVTEGLGGSNIPLWLAYNGGGAYLATAIPDNEPNDGSVISQ